MEGISGFFLAEHNAWLHLIATIAVFVLAAVVGVTKNELLALVFAGDSGHRNANAAHHSRLRRFSATVVRGGVSSGR